MRKKGDKGGRREEEGIAKAKDGHKSKAMSCENFQSLWVVAEVDGRTRLQTIFY